MTCYVQHVTIFKQFDIYVRGVIHWLLCFELEVLNLMVVLYFSEQLYHKSYLHHIIMERNLHDLFLI